MIFLGNLKLGFRRASFFFGHVVADRELDFDQVGHWYKLENGALLPPSDDEGEDDGAVKDHPIED